MVEEQGGLSCQKSVERNQCTVQANNSKHRAAKKLQYLQDTGKLSRQAAENYSIALFTDIWSQSAATNQSSEFMEKHTASDLFHMGIRHSKSVFLVYKSNNIFWLSLEFAARFTAFKDEER